MAQDTRSIKQFNALRDSLTHLGAKFINDPDDMERKNANYQFIRTLVSTLKLPGSFNYSFDSVKSISVLNAPDNRFRIFTWHVINVDGSYRFYGAVQMNTGGALKLFPLEDYSPLLKNPEDSVTDNRKWYGAQYYKIVSVKNSTTPYYVLLGWKGHTVKSTKKVIDAISFNRNGQPLFGADVFVGNGKKTRKRVVFEYSRQASMLLRYVPDDNIIVFDHLSPPDKSSSGKPETFGPDLSYDGYRLSNGKWQFVENLDMRNIATAQDQNEYIDPKKQAIKDRQQVPSRH
ncbi:hypothetical protein GCM10023313_18460 [Mucilaginibacter defluvii]|uniref:Uncharacterized protein n=2 Tax=Mucilaginibacter defluvii TaxID=1196019 RepID=A0ABP9FZ39_9SPHI